MSSGVIIVLIIVVWLFVLAPVLLRGQRPIHKAGDAYNDTRVVYEGGSGALETHKTPTPARRDAHDEPDEEIVSAEEIDDVELVDEEPAEFIDGDVVACRDDETESVDVDSNDDAESEIVVETDEEPEAVVLPIDNGGTYDDPEDFIDASDLLHPFERAEAAAEYVSEDADEDPEVDTSLELTDDEVEFARRRSARGGWDPDADRERALDLYARRTRTVIGLAVACVVATIIGIVAGGWTWWLFGVAAALTVAYLFALRHQVVQERELRARRIRHLRRARLGVRQSDAPDYLRRPGGIVLELDDDSPDFHELPTAKEPEEPDIRLQDAG